MNAPLTAAAPPTMRALLQRRYGADAVAFAEVPAPTAAPGAVLIQVVSAALNRGDWHLLTGTPYAVRLAGYGVLRPNRAIPGMAVAGRVVAVGAGVTGFAPGDGVLGEIDGGGFAERVNAAPGALAKIPAGVSFEQAATLPISGTTALQGLRDAGALKAGESLLVIGAAGGVGGFAVQLGRHFGAEVTGVCSAKNVEGVRAMGAHHVIDYTATRLGDHPARFDVILDLVGAEPLASLRRMLKPGGRLVSGSGGQDNVVLGPMFPILRGLLSNLGATERFIPLMNKPTPSDLEVLCALVAEGAITPDISARIGLSEAPGYLDRMGEGHTRGKVVIQIDADSARSAR
ncbi:NAD(P)-dependent alcohol dehydrogenase [Myxococcota bacterium]|nr:NAD(P)-dependent alcohol dehydrogenase [Myxococcota bacterium]